MTLAPQPLEPRRRCQHCDRDIFPGAGGRWQDRDGIMVCIKLPLSQLGQPWNYIFHTPLPAKLEGRNENA